MGSRASSTSTVVPSGKRPLWKRLALLGSLVVVMGIVAASGFWLAGRKVWTDGRDLRMPAADANLREILWTRPQTLGPTFNSDAQEYEPSVSPDGQEVYFVRGKPAQGDGEGETTGADIFVSYRRNNAWTAPVALDDVNTTFDDLGPRLTPDGNFLLFYSDRPGGVGGYDLWAAPRTETGFGPAFNLGPSVNTEFNEFSPAPTPDGKRLFFATNRKAGYAQQRDAWKATIRQTGLGDYDLFVSDLTAGQGPAATQPANGPATAPTSPATAPTTAPTANLDPAAAAMLELIGPAPHATTQPATAPSTRPAPTTLVAGSATEVPGVNTMYHEGASCLSPAGDFLYFASNRPGGVGKFDLYRVRIHEGAYGAVENLGREVNTPENEADPQLAMGGFQMYFSSDRAPGPDTVASSYDLLTAESREVYPDRQSRPVPKFGLSAWLLLAALLALIPLLFMLRGWSDGRLNLFQKCLLVSVLLHVLLTILFSAAKVSHEIVVYVKEQKLAEMTVTVAEAGGGGAAYDVAQQARQQLTDTAVDVPEPAALPQQAQPAMELPKANDLAQLNIPLARPDAGAMQIQIDPPKATPTPLPDAPAPRVAIAPPEFRPAAPQLDLKPAPRVEAAEAAMQVAPADAPVARAVEGPAVQVAPQAVRVDLAPAAVQVGPSMAKAVDVAPPTVVSPDVAVAGPSVATPTAPQAIAVTGPKIDAAKVASAAPAAPAASEGDLGASRQATGSSAGEAATVQTGVPQASVTSGSLASAAPVGRSLPQEAIETTVKPMVERGGADTIAVRPPTTQPLRKVEQAGPVIAGADMPTPQVRTAPAAAATDTARAVGLPQTAAAPVKAADAAGGPIDTPLMQPATRPAGMGVASIDVASGARPTAATQPATVAPDATAMATNIGAKAARVAAEGPALPGATEASVAAQRQQASVAAGAAQSVQTTAPAVAKADASAGASGPAASLAAAAGMTGPRAVEAAVPAPAAQGPRDVAKSAPAVEVAAAGGAMGAKKVNGADVAVAAADAPAAVVGRTNVAADVAAPDAIRVDPAAAAGAVAGAATAGGSNPSLAAGAGAAPRMVNVAPGVAAVQPGKPIDGAPFALPGSAAVKPLVASNVGGTSPEVTTEAPAAVAGRAEVKTQVAGPERIELAAAPTVAAKVPGALPTVNVAVGAAPRMADASSSALNFEVRVAAPKLSAPPAMFQRSAEQRKPMLEKMGGTKQSEEAVERALAYLARNQEGSGHWTLVRGDRGNRKGGKGDSSSHDPALTGLSVLAFLAADHTPTDPGPYQDVVARGIEYLLTIQKPDGDLRGKRPGGGADNGNMYDHGIAAFALAEAALMTGDKRFTEAAFRACDFIVKAQHRRTGGWRYVPGESGDTSVFGWQVMALHSAEQVGYQIPADCRAGMEKYIDIASSGKQRMLGGYQPGGSGTQAMTAELLFCRIMLDHEITPQQEQEVSRFLTRDLPDTRNADFYCWYYGSLSLIQLQNDAWKQWNERTRETLIAMQTKGGDNDGMFDGNITWKGQGGRIYTTALATLTLEVYYRYLPLRAEAQR